MKHYEVGMESCASDSSDLNKRVPFLQECVERIRAKGEGECEPYYFDWLKCIDKCVSKISSRSLLVLMNACL